MKQLDAFDEPQAAPQLIVGDDVFTVGTSAAFATFSRCERYRYVLGRQWDPLAPWLVCCLLNPSTATHEVLDPTLRRVRDFAKRDEFGGFIIVNAFAYRSTDRSVLKHMIYPDAVGPRNDEAIETAVSSPILAKAVAGWGRPDTKDIGRRMAHVRLIINLRRTVHVWGATKEGHPRHPLYLKKTAPLVPLHEAIP